MWPIMMTITMMPAPLKLRLPVLKRRGKCLSDTCIEAMQVMLDHLEGIVIAWLFELEKMNQAGIGQYIDCLPD